MRGQYPYCFRHSALKSINFKQKKNNQFFTQTYSSLNNHSRDEEGLRRAEKKRKLKFHGFFFSSADAYRAVVIKVTR